MKLQRVVCVWVALALGLAACQPGDADQAIRAGAAETTAAGPAETSAPAQADAPIPTLEGKPPQTNAAEIRPPERRKELTRLSTLLDFQVTGLNGVVLGQVTDFIVNSCETYIVYVLVEPADDLQVDPGSRLVIPFEAATINSGVLDAEAKTIALYLAPGNLNSAPAFPEPLALFPTDWETSVREYWQAVVRVGKLSSECLAGNSAPGAGVQKIAYARQLLAAELKDGNQNLLGTVREAILEPESGKLGFYVVELAQGNQGLVLVPLGKTNIPEAALQPGSTIELVLLAENDQLSNAPRLASLDGAVSAGAQNTARQYWGQ